MSLRFYAFSDEELEVLWRGLTTDGGVIYGIDADDGPERTLALEVKAEADRRGITGAIWKAAA